MLKTPKGDGGSGGYPLAMMSSSVSGDVREIVRSGHGGAYSAIDKAPRFFMVFSDTLEVGGEHLRETLSGSVSGEFSISVGVGVEGQCVFFVEQPTDNTSQETLASVGCSYDWCMR